MALEGKENKRWFVLAVLCLVLFIISIDSTVLNLALPSISKGLGASASQLQWVVDSYTLVFASLLITTGTIGDRYGRKMLLGIGLAFFGVGSLGAALSFKTNMLIGFRLLQGMAGSMIMPSTLSILTNTFRDAKERMRAIAIWSSIFSIGAGIGPVIGGVLIDRFEWSSVFYLNLPIVVICLAGLFFFVDESKNPSGPKPDLAGVTFSIIGLMALVFGLIRAGDFGWTSGTVVISFGIALVFLAAFFWWERHSANPMLPLEFFKNMSFTGANLALTLSAFAMMGSMYFFSQYLQSVQENDPLMASFMMFPMTPFVFGSTMLSIRVNHRLGTKKTMALGLLISGSGLFIFSRFAGIDSSYWHFLLVLFCMGCGMGLTMSPATNSIMSSLPPSRAGIGSAMNDTTRQLGGALGIAVLGSIMNGIYRLKINLLGNMQGMTASLLEQVRSSIQSAHLAAAGVNSSLGNLVTHASSQAFVDGMKQTLTIASFIMIIAAAAAFTLLPAKEKAIEPSIEAEPELARARD